MLTQNNPDRQCAFLHSPNCINSAQTWCRSWRFRKLLMVCHGNRGERVGQGKARKTGYEYQYLEYRCICSKLPAVSGVTRCAYYVYRSDTVYSGGSETEWPPRIGSKWLYIETIYWLSITTVCILGTIVEHPMTVHISLRWASTEHQPLLVFPCRQSKQCIVTSFQRGSIGRFSSWKGEWYASCPILNFSINWAFIIIGLHSCLIKWLCNVVDP